MVSHIFEPSHIILVEMISPHLIFLWCLSLKLFFFKDFIYLFMRDKQRHRQREKQAPCGEPDAGLDPRTPGSRPEPEADAPPLSPPGCSYPAPSPRRQETTSQHSIGLPAGGAGFPEGPVICVQWEATSSPKPQRDTLWKATLWSRVTGFLNQSNHFF